MRVTTIYNAAVATAGRYLLDMKKHLFNKKPLVTCCIASFLSGCLGGGGSGGDDHLQGQLLPNGIEGLSYQTASVTGTTDASGHFSYYDGEKLQFAVGNLVLVADVPADEMVTPLEFFADTRAQLNTSPVNDEGLLDHRLTEQALLQNSSVINIVRFLMALSWRETIQEGDGIDIRTRVIDQLNAALPALAEPIDFSVGPLDFELNTADEMSPANILLSKICFYEEDDERCEEPPSQAEIDNAPDKPDDDDQVDPNIVYKEDLIAKRNLIENAKREMLDFTVAEAEDYLTRELDAITRMYSNRYYLNSETASYPASDTNIHEVNVRRIGGSPSLAAMEAVSLRDTDVTIHSYDWQSATVDYFISGSSGGESELLINFRPESNYRWIKKQLRVIIQ